MPKTLLGNSLLLGVFLLLLALPMGSFGFLRYPSGSSAVLSATTEDFGGKLILGRSYNPVTLKEVTAVAFAGQKATYSDVFFVTNTSAVNKTYKVSVIRATTTTGVYSQWYFSNLRPVITLGPGESSSVSLSLTYASTTSQISVDYLVAIEN